MNLKEIKELIELLKNTDIAELEIERSGVKVRIRKGGDVTFPSSMPRMEYPPATIVAPVHTEASASGSPAGKAERLVKTDLVRVTSPIVGTFYRSNAPDKPAYVEVGDIVKKGQILCIIEAMKLMNEIECESSGKIMQILVESSAPVEYGQPLFLIDPA